MGKAFVDARVVVIALLVVVTVGISLDYSTDKDNTESEQISTDPALALAGNGLGNGGSSDGELDYDVQNKVYWPVDTKGWQTGYKGSCSRRQFVSPPALNCWFQALVYNGQQKMIDLAGGIFAEKFNRSKGQQLANDKGLATKGKLVGKGKDEGMDLVKGKDLGNTAAAVAAAAVLIQPQSSTVQAWPAACSAVAATGTDGGETDADNLALAAKLKERTIENCQGGFSSLSTLRDGFASSTSQKPQTQSVCGANHEKASAGAKALRCREAAATSLQDAQAEMDRLKDQYEKDKEEPREKYARCKTEHTETFEEETMQCYTTVASSTQIPPLIAHIVNALAVDEAGADTDAEKKSDKTKSPSNSDDERDGNDKDNIDDNDGGLQEHPKLGACNSTDRTEPKQTEEGFQLGGTVNRKGQPKATHAAPASAKGQGIGSGVKKKSLRKYVKKLEQGLSLTTRLSQARQRRLGSWPKKLGRWHLQSRRVVNLSMCSWKLLKESTSSAVLTPNCSRTPSTQPHGTCCSQSMAWLSKHSFKRWLQKMRPFSP